MISPADAIRYYCRRKLDVFVMLGILRKIQSGSGSYLPVLQLRLSVSPQGRLKFHVGASLQPQAFHPGVNPHIGY